MLREFQKLSVASQGFQGPWGNQHRRQIRPVRYEQSPNFYLTSYSVTFPLHYEGSCSLVLWSDELFDPGEGEQAVREAARHFRPWLQ